MVQSFSVAVPLSMYKPPPVLAFEPRVMVAEPLEDTEEARHAAELTNAFVEGSARILEASEVNARRVAEGRLVANAILTRDGGDHIPRLQSIGKRFGPSWGCFVEMPVERGISMVLGMGVVDAPTGEYFSPEWVARMAQLTPQQRLEAFSRKPGA